MPADNSPAEGSFITEDEAQVATREFGELKRLWADALRFEAQRRLGNKLFPVGSSRERFLKWTVGAVRGLRGHSQITSRPEELERLDAVDRVLQQAPNAFAAQRQYAASLQRMFISVRNPGPDYVRRMPRPEGWENKSGVKPIAFYLPQFHPIPENDEWWGRGFTEWTNVAKAVPLFDGHYQPHLPDELGFYDLRVPEVLEAQAQLAQDYGVYGFAFYYYWFAGKTLLEQPLREFASNPNISLPFCIVWANENWTRTWDGQDEDVLIGQNHTPENDLAIMRDLIPYMRNDRYIRVGERPLVIVYRPMLLPDVKATAAAWRKLCTESGLADPYLVSTQSVEPHDPREIGFDATVPFPPNRDHGAELLLHSRGKRGIDLVDSNLDVSVFSYPLLVENKVSSDESFEYPRFEAVCPMWDNSARRPGRGTIFAYSKPALYAKWLAKACERTAANSELPERFVFINAWNEWAEGAHLEPDQRYGCAYLEATRDVLSGRVD